MKMTNNVKYRENSLDPKHLNLILEFALLGIDEVLFFITVKTEALSRDEYKVWVSDWKRFYNAVSIDIRSAKDAGNHQTVNKLRLVANTLINARQYARDRRRSIQNRLTA
jgi:hypothetical protein